MRFAPLLVCLSVLAMVFPAGAKEKEAKEAADDTVTSCDSYGKNFYALPNTGVCVAAGGQAELTGTASRLSNGLQQNQLVFHGALAADIRTQTGLGELRGFARASYYSDSHSWSPDYLFISLTSPDTNVFAQIGYSDSTFNYLGGGPAVGTLRGANLSAKLIRTTYKITPSLTAKIALEADAQERPRSVADPISNIFPRAVPSITTTDKTQPDLVAALSFEPKAGSAQLSAVLHRVQSPVATIKDKTGFAVQFGMTYPLDIAVPDNDDGDADSDDDEASDDTDTDDASDSDAKNSQDAKVKTAKAAKAPKPWEITHSFAWQLAYANGATLYLGYGTGRFSKAAVDAVVLPNGTLQLVSGVSALAYYSIGWMPKVTQNVFGSWSQLSPPSAAIGFNLQGSRDYTEARFGTNFVYEPWKDFTITLEAMAMRADLSGIRNGVATQLVNGTTAYQFSLQVSKIF